MMFSLADFAISFEVHCLWMFHIIMIFNFVQTFCSNVLAFCACCSLNLHQPVTEMSLSIALCHFVQFAAANFRVLAAPDFCQIWRKRALRDQSRQTLLCLQSRWNWCCETAINQMACASRLVAAVHVCRRTLPADVWPSAAWRCVVALAQQFCFQLAYSSIFHFSI